MPTLTITIDIPVDDETQTFGRPKITHFEFDVDDSSWVGDMCCGAVFGKITRALQSDVVAAQTSLGTLGLTTQTTNMLHRRRVLSVEQLEAMTADQILDLRGIGPGKLGEIREMLKTHGRKLSGD